MAAPGGNPRGGPRPDRLKTERRPKVSHRWWKTEAWKTEAAPGAFLAAMLWTLAPGISGAHCDSLDGPVVLEARSALAGGDVTPLLKWVPAGDEENLRAAFARALQVRDLGPAARDLADQYFFETLVRIHRAGEGAPYAGLKAAGSAEPGIHLADAVLESGSADGLTEAVLGHVGEGIRERFERAVETGRHRDESVEAGRAWVAAYVTFIHYVEGIQEAAAGTGDHGTEVPDGPPPGHGRVH